MIKISDLRHYTNRIKYIFFQKVFNYATSDIYNTKKFTEFNENSELVILSMVQKKDMSMYLIAIKSLLRFLSVHKVIIVCDQNLTASDKSILKEHIEKLELYDAADFRHEKLPKGGCWERLAAIARFSNDYYVIQMDADTLTLTNPMEIIEATHKNTPFILGSEERFNKKITLLEMNEIAKGWISKGSNHVQVFCENELSNLTEMPSYKYYIRGCAGFAGFPKKSISTDELIHLSNVFYEKLNSRWLEWGTEQFASNLILSNLNDVAVLPLLEYTTPDNFNGKNTFLHFIGYLRFTSFLYQKLAVNFIKQMMSTKA